ncbi:MAG: hypothetical protein MI919_10690, partial [Holophagales bacterium]|nr:hypothetical protein [Holophagales bacterium]
EDLIAWTPAFTTLTTRSRTLTDCLLEDWNGIDFQNIYYGEKTGSIRAPGLKDDPTWATADAVTFGDELTGLPSTKFQV